MFHTLPSINGVSTKFSSRQLPGRLFQFRADEEDGSVPEKPMVVVVVVVGQSM